VGPLVTFEEALRAAGGLKLLPYEEERRHKLADRLRALPQRPRTVSLLIGPEGGFEAEEVRAATASGAEIVTLGRRVLRSETAAIVAAAIVLHELDG